MEYRELVKRLQYEMAEKLDSSMTVKVGKMEKEPEGTYTVLSIGFADKDMVQGWMINVDALYLEHPELGVSGMVWEITKSMMRDLVSAGKKFAEVFPYWTVENLVTMKKIPTKGNESLLSEVPHRENGKMSVVYQVEVKDEDGSITIPITNDMLSEYYVSEERLHKAALKNMPERNREEKKTVRDRNER